MPTQIKLPNLGENIESGDVLTILVSEGDVVKADQDLLEVETDKATMPIPSPQAGKITKILVGEGDTVESARRSWRSKRPAPLTKPPRRSPRRPKKKKPAAPAKPKQPAPEPEEEEAAEEADADDDGLEEEPAAKAPPQETQEARAGRRG